MKLNKKLVILGLVAGGAGKAGSGSPPNIISVGYIEILIQSHNAICITTNNFVSSALDYF